LRTKVLTGLHFKLGWFAHPIFSADGDYPAVMKEYIARHSAEEGYPESRLPVFGQQWVDYIKGVRIVSYSFAPL